MSNHRKKHLTSSSGHTLSFLFQENVSDGISNPGLFCNLFYKLRWRIVISYGSKVEKLLRRRKYDPVIIEKIIGFVFGPSTALYNYFLKRCTLTNKAFGTISKDLSKLSQRTHGPDPRPSDFNSELIQPFYLGSITVWTKLSLKL